MTRSGTLTPGFRPLVAKSVTGTVGQCSSKNFSSFEYREVIFHVRWLHNNKFLSTRVTVVQWVLSGSWFRTPIYGKNYLFLSTISKMIIQSVGERKISYKDLLSLSPLTPYWDPFVTVPPKYVTITIHLLWQFLTVLKPFFYNPISGIRLEDNFTTRGLLLSYVPVGVWGRVDFFHVLP